MDSERTRKTAELVGEFMTETGLSEILQHRVLLGIGSFQTHNSLFLNTVCEIRVGIRHARHAELQLRLQCEGMQDV